MTADDEKRLAQIRRDMKLCQKGWGDRTDEFLLRLLDEALPVVEAACAWGADIKDGSDRNGRTPKGGSAISCREGSNMSDEPSKEPWLRDPWMERAAQACGFVAMPDPVALFPRQMELVESVARALAAVSDKARRGERERCAAILKSMASGIWANSALVQDAIFGERPAEPVADGGERED